MANNTKTSKLKKVAQKWDEIDYFWQRILKFCAAIGVIIGFVTSVLGWANGQLVDAVETQLASHLTSSETKLEGITARLEESESKSELSNTRVELLILINHNPTNVVEIEKVARHYFIDLGGDWYMSQIYSDWAKDYGGDVSFVAHRT